LVADFNALNLAGFLENDEAIPAVQPVAAPLGQVIQLLRDFSRPEWQPSPEVTLVWTQPEQVVPAFQSAALGLPVDEVKALAEVDEFASLLAGAAARLKWIFVPAWAHDPGLATGALNGWQAGHGAARLLAQMNLRLADQLARCPNVFLFDTQRWLLAAGASAFNDKLWYQGKIPFAHAVFQTAVKDIKSALRGLQGLSRKLVVVDLDDTLWGGVVGDVGWEGLQLGGHDPFGEAYVDFQKTLKALTRRGIVLGIVSKNDEGVALKAIAEHPEMQLRLTDFAGWRINWEDKAKNLVDLAAELRLGLQSVVFIDDQPAERARVREELPEVLVPDWPENPMLFRRALLALNCFENPAMTAEDGARAGAYAAERQRAELKRQVGSVEDWLKSLHITVKVERLSAANLPRAAQLLNKTNQVNLSTRRMSESELRAWADLPGHFVWVFRVSDKLGDSGLTGLASLKVTGETAQIVDFILSCRVMGRKVEECMVQWLVSQARQAEVREVWAEHLPTEKNQPGLEFWRRSGFHPENSHRFRWHTGVKFPKPEYIQLIVEGNGTGTTARVAIEVGRTSELRCVATAKTVAEFMALTGDHSPLHADEEYARHSSYGRILVHGMCPLLFLSALELVQQPGRRAVFRTLAANFNQPIYPGDPLLLEARVAEYIPDLREVGIEFQIKNRQTGAELTSGLATFVLEKISEDTSILTAPRAGPPLMVAGPLQGESLTLEQIERGAEKSFPFQVADPAVKAYYELLRGAVEDFEVDYETWRWRCDVAGLLATALISTFVGQCIPGSYGTCRNFDLTFHQPLHKNRPYRFGGKVVFKSASTASVINQIVIDDPNGAAGVALVVGKIHAGVNPPQLVAT
jgi:FkbH-like protein